MSSQPAENTHSASREPEIPPLAMETPQLEKQSAHLLPVVLLSLGGVCAFVLRWYGLGSRSLWWDEGYTEWVSRFPVSGIYRALQTDSAPPLFYVLEHFWIQLFGLSDTSLRGMSAFFSTLSLPLFYLLARRLLLDAEATAIAFWLFALSLLQIWYAREARFYALLAFLSLTALYSLIGFLERRSFLLICVLVLSVTASLYTHNMAFFYLPALALVWLFYPSLRSMPRRIAEISVAGASVLVLYLPWIPSLWRQMKLVRQSFWAAPPTPSKLLDTLLVLSGFSPEYLSALSIRLLHLPSQFALLLLSFVAITCLAVWIAYGVYHAVAADRFKVLALLAYSTVPVVLAFIVSNVATSVFLNRVFIASSAVLPILLAAPIALQRSSRQPLRLILGVALVGLTAVSLFGYLRFVQKENWKGATRYVLEIPGPDRLVLFVPEHGQMLFDYYAAGVVFSPRPDEVGLPENFNFHEPIPPLDLTGPDLIGNLRRAVESRRYNEIYAVVSHAPARLAGPALEYLSAHCSSREEKDFYQLTVIRCLVKKE